MLKANPNTAMIISPINSDTEEDSAACNQMVISPIESDTEEDSAAQNQSTQPLANNINRFFSTITVKPGQKLTFHPETLSINNENKPDTKELTLKLS